jgi:hypothetical protein
MAGVTRASAQGLAGGGALLTAFSLLTPWYVLRVGALSGNGKSGAAALGALAWVIVALAVAAGWSMTARVHPLLPALAAVAIAAIVLAKIVSPPTPTELSGGTTGNPIADAFAKALTNAAGFHYATTWGIWLAAVGAAATVAGTVAYARGATP